MNNNNKNIKNDPVMINLEAEMGLEQMKALVPTQMKLYKEIAKMSRGYYNVLIDEGFIDEQSLRIVRY